MKFLALKSRFKARHGERPLAWAQLSHQKVRLLVALGGITFANVLIFMQLGFRSLFTEGATALPESIAGDLFLVNPSTRFIGARGFDRIRLYQAASVRGVANSTPLYIEDGVWAYSQENISFQARIYAFNPKQQVFQIPEVTQQAAKLNLPGSVLFDRLSRSSFGPIPQQVAERGYATAFLNQRRIAVVGLFNMGNSFFIGEGNVIMSEANYRDLFGEEALKRVGVGILTLEPGADIAAVKAGIQATVPGVEVLTHAELIAKELKFQESTPAGPIFSFGAIMGFVIGVVVVYQVLYADISDHLSEYATLKAIGYSDLALLRVILQEALLLGILGFAPGCVTSFFMYGLLAHITRLELVMRLDVAVTVLILTLIMCVASAAIASNKLRSADPADVF
ncbi:ABC transporter permease protein (plasmid) [Leptolyngbya sp. NIES-3755]|nr:ABC transporter permease protein [Leptolyngbya sp. NIES-3755]